MTVPPPPRPVPARSDTGESWHTARSGTFVSVRVAHGPQGVTIAPSHAPIPEDVPEPPPGAVSSLHVPQTGQSYSAARVDDMGGTLEEPSPDSNSWQLRIRRFMLAIADLGPTALQGIAPFTGGGEPARDHCRHRGTIHQSLL